MLSFEQQDAIEHLIFTGRLGGGVDAEPLERLGLIARGEFGNWFYTGGPISQFFTYTQTKGMSDGIHA